MKKRITAFFLLINFILTLFISACDPNREEEYTKEDYALNMNMSYPAVKGLENGEGGAVKVILLLGQSNASGCSVTECLKENISAEKFAEYEAGYDNVKINYCIDDHAFTSSGEFVTVDLTCGCGDGFFGPEVGMAEVLSSIFADEDVFILKYTMSGYSLNYHWLYDGERAWIYDACIAFVEHYMSELSNNGYIPTLGAVCWMQGESDTTHYKASRYYENQIKFVSYLRADLSMYKNKEIYFIDAGISNSPYCEPAYPEINEAKRKFSELSPYNIYFDTIEMGFTTLYEPAYAPDLGHYDSLYEIELGRRFGEETAKAFL